MIESRQEPLMGRRPTRVIKVGGSLLDLPDLGDRILDWIEHQPPAYSLLISGGGKLVAAIRNQHTSQPLDDQTSHWRCIDIMTETAKSLAEILPESDLVVSLPSPDYLTAASTVIFSPATWLRESEPQLAGIRLRESWDVTSDSIAARVAICLTAAELVLLKSADAPSRDFVELAQCGYVDSMFPELAREIPLVRMVNLLNAEGGRRKAE